MIHGSIDPFDAGGWVIGTAQAKRNEVVDLVLIPPSVAEVQSKATLRSRHLVDGDGRRIRSAPIAWCAAWPPQRGRPAQQYRRCYRDAGRGLGFFAPSHFAT